MSGAGGMARVRSTNAVLAALLLALLALIGGLTWCGQGGAPDPGWEGNPRILQGEELEKALEKAGKSGRRQEGGTPATTTGP